MKPLPKKLPPAVLAYFAAQGKIGGHLRAENLTAKQRKDIASLAARTRWAKTKKKGANR